MHRYPLAVMEDALEAKWLTWPSRTVNVRHGSHGRRGRPMTDVGYIVFGWVVVVGGLGTYALRVVRPPAGL